jgi:predicted dithiol-disulfide oxidoreductase (DUF899 family)
VTRHMTGTRQEWPAARLELLKAEKELNFDFNVSLTEEQKRHGGVEYNYKRRGHVLDAKPKAAAGGPVAFAAMTEPTWPPMCAKGRA